jgi:hypothetical protein
MQHELGNLMIAILVTNRRQFITFPLQLPGKRGCHLLEGDRLATLLCAVGGKARGSCQTELKLAVRPR